MPAKKKNIAALLSHDSPKPTVRRGQGMRLSTEDTPIAPPAHEDAGTQRRRNAKAQKRKDAETQSMRPKRVNRGYMLREDLIKGLRLLAVEEDRKLYEVMEEALAEYLARRTSAAR